MNTRNRDHANRPTAYVRPVARITRQPVTLAMLAPRAFIILAAVLVIGGVL